MRVMNFSPDPRMNRYVDKVIDSGDPIRINALKGFNNTMLADLYRMVNMNTLSEYRKICDHFHVPE